MLSRSGVKPSYSGIWLVSSGTFAPWPGGRTSTASSAWSDGVPTPVAEATPSTSAPASAAMSGTAFGGTPMTLT